jgi:hypothetical protein
MHDPAADELDLALENYCDEILNDITIPTAEGLVRRIHWLYRNREFRATVPVWAENQPVLTPGAYADWRRHGQQFFHLPSHPVFEVRGAGVSWDDVLNVGIWRWLLTTAGRRGGDDERPGDVSGSPVRPRPVVPPGLSAGAEAIPEFAPREVRHHTTLRLAPR